MMKNISRFLRVLRFCFLGIGLSIIATPSVANSSCQEIMNNDFCNKVGQMLIVGFGGMDQNSDGKITWNDPNGLNFEQHSLIAQHITKHHIGGVVLFAQPYRHAKTKQFIRDRNIQNQIQVAALNEGLQQHNTKIRRQQKLEQIPLFIGIDQEGGRIDRMPAQLGFASTTLPAQAFGAKEELKLKQSRPKTEALEETFVYAQKLAQELAATHFNVNFAPVVDVNLNPTNPIIGGLGRSFSSNPNIVVDQAKQFIRAFHSKQLIAALKHFPGHGNSDSDTHLALVDVTKNYNKQQELLPYFALIKDGYADMIMTAHVINGKIDHTQCKSGTKNDPSTFCPGTMSYHTLTHLLRHKMGFGGVIVSDDLSMGAIAREYPLPEALQKAINAGVDLLIISNNSSDQTEIVINTIAQLVKEGKIPQSRIDEAYRRIITLKKRIGNTTQ